MLCHNYNAIVVESIPIISSGMLQTMTKTWSTVYYIEVYLFKVSSILLSIQLPCEVPESMQYNEMNGYHQCCSLQLQENK